MSPKTQVTKEKAAKLDYIKIKSVGALKNTNRENEKTMLRLHENIYQLYS